jgi:hypothetical protein
LGFESSAVVMRWTRSKIRDALRRQAPRHGTADLPIPGSHLPWLIRRQDRITAAIVAVVAAYLLTRSLPDELKFLDTIQSWHRHVGIGEE